MQFVPDVVSESRTARCHGSLFVRHSPRFAVVGPLGQNARVVQGSQEPLSDGVDDIVDASVAEHRVEVALEILNAANLDQTLLAL